MCLYVCVYGVLFAYVKRERAREQRDIEGGKFDVCVHACVCVHE